MLKQPTYGEASLVVLSAMFCSCKLLRLLTRFFLSVLYYSNSNGTPGCLSGTDPHLGAVFDVPFVRWTFATLEALVYSGLAIFHSVSSALQISHIIEIQE
jgi:hypothetical protein